MTRKNRHLTYSVSAQRLGPHGSLARCKSAEITLDTDLHGRTDAFNPAELMLAALAACMIKNIERVAPIIGFEFSGVSVQITGQRRDRPPAMERIEYALQVETEESDHRLELLHRNVMQYGTVYNTLAQGCELVGTLTRA